jgi:hypothetical protein
VVVVGFAVDTEVVATIFVVSIDVSFLWKSRRAAPLDKLATHLPSAFVSSAPRRKRLSQRFWVFLLMFP